MNSLRHYPQSTFLLGQYRDFIGGNQTGILPGYFVNVAAVEGEPTMRSMTATMPNYHRLVSGDPKASMQYHLSGYGGTNEEAFIRMSGEAIERYGSLLANGLFPDRIVYASYDELSRTEDCVSLDYLGIFDEAQQSQISQMMPRYSADGPSTSDTICWLRCPSLLTSGADVYIPAQLFFLWFQPDTEKGDRMYTPSFSTGTGAHTDILRALKSALIESVQIDAFTLHWYTATPGRRVVIDSPRVRSYLEGIGLGPDGKYDIVLVHITRPELPIPNIGAYLLRRDGGFPFVSFGVQADPDPEIAAIRAITEALAITSMNTYAAVFDTMNLLFATNASAFTDLDTNVLHWASTLDQDSKVASIMKRVEGSVRLSEIAPLENPLEDLLTMLRRFGRWGGYLDITPPELSRTPWKVVRAFVPELLSMCLPGLPPRKHPRFDQYGGVAYVEPHPLP
jgi:thiazole/oxazole-forming peptide maturase SagD family component